MEPSNRLCLINVPIYMTKIQLIERFFKDLGIDQKLINFPKSLFRKEEETKVGFIQFQTINEAKLAKTIIINAEFKGIIPKFARDNKDAMNIQNGDVLNAADVIDFQKCAFCGADNSDIILVCSGCSNYITGTFYCNADHQARDWIRHKSECKPMPTLRNFQDLKLNEAPLLPDHIQNNEETSRPKFFIKSIKNQPNVGDKIFITKVRSSRVVFVRPVSEDDGYEKLLKDIKNAVNNSSKKSDKPDINDHVLAPYRNSFHRAKILDIFECDENDCNTKVFMVDFGDEIKVKWQECKNLNYRLRGVKSFIFKFVLDGIEISYENQDAMNYLNEIFQSNEALLISNVSGDRKILKRINGEIVNDEINQIALRTSSISAVNSFEPVLYNTLTIPKVEPGTAVKLSIVDNTNLVSDKTVACMPQEKFAEYMKLMTAIREYSKNISAESYTPIVPHEIILAKFKGTWHRAAISSLNALPERVAVHFIDILINADVAVENIRKLPKALTQQIFTQKYYVDCTDTDFENANFREKLEPGSITVNIQINDNHPILRFN